MDARAFPLPSESRLPPDFCARLRVRVAIEIPPDDLEQDVLFQKFGIFLRGCE